MDYYLFDVFGTCVDVKGSLTRHLSRAGVPKPEAFADVWIAQYGARLRTLSGWRNLDEILAEEFFLTAAARSFAPAKAADAVVLAGAWSRLDAWPDAADGLERLAMFAQLGAGFELCAFSNANEEMLRSLVGYAGLPFTRRISAESCRRYKPDPAIYAAAVAQLGTTPDNVTLVAAHCFDCNAARKAGFGGTVLVERAGEPGSARSGLDHQASLIVPDLAAFADAVYASSREDR